MKKHKEAIEMEHPCKTPQAHLSICLIMSFILYLTLLTGCSNSDEAWMEYMKDNDGLTDNAKEICKDHGQEYLMHHYTGLDWEVICYHRSPIRHFYYDLG